MGAAPYIAVICIALFFILLFGMIVKNARDKRKGLYTPAACSICGNSTGYQGNRCFKLIGGCMCQSCACKLIPNLQMDSLSHEWFLKNSVYNTVDDVTAKITAQTTTEQH